MRWSRFVLALAVAASPAASPARAIDVPVQYLVDDKALKEAVAGTPLTYTLYSDPSCALQLFADDLAVEDATIEQLKRARPKGAAKPPKTARLGVTLRNVPPSASLFLGVSGTGVVPVGGACQAQAAPSGVGLPFLWMTVTDDAAIRNISPGLEGATVERAVGQPVGAYCIFLPEAVRPGIGEAVVGSVQKNLSFDAPRTLTVTTFIGHECNANGFWQIAVDTYDGAGARVDAPFSLFLPAQVPGPSK
jgi:hypothetical protein